MKNLKHMMELFKTPNYKFFYVDTSKGDVIPMDDMYINTVVKEYEELNNAKTNEDNSNLSIVVTLREFVTNSNLQNQLEKWFEDGHEEFFDEMYEYYKMLYITFSNLEFFDNGNLTNELLKKFNDSYSCSFYGTVYVKLYITNDPRIVYIKFEKEERKNENC